MNATHRPPAVPVRADRLLVVLSDVEMGAGGPMDDFPHTDWLAELLLSYDRGPHGELAIDLVFNGDTFDFLKTAYLDGYPRHIGRDVALGKLLRIAAAHPRFFEGLRRFLASDRGERRVWFVTGNHDYELLFPEVQAAIRVLTGSPDRVHFPGFTLDIGDVHVEHGHQADRLFAMDPDQLFVEHQGEPILNLPWGAVALLDVALPLHHLVYHHDRLKPRGEVFRLLPELRELAVERYWAYWTRDYWRGWLSGADPIKRLSWTMFRDVMYRFGSRDIDTHLDDQYERLVRRDDGPRVCLIGHLHEAAWVSFDDRKLLRTGAMRNEFLIAPDGEGVTPLPKVYAEVFLAGERAVRSQLVEVEGPPPPPGYVPDSLLDVRPAIVDLLGPPEERRKVAAAAATQEEKEARAPAPPAASQPFLARLIGARAAPAEPPALPAPDDPEALPHEVTEELELERDAEVELLDED